jgi:hypothetical protein
LTRAIPIATDENVIKNMWTFLKGHIPDYQKEIKKKRKIGFLKGKAKVVFHDNWSMTLEELGMV